MFVPSIQVKNAHYGGAYDHKARWLNYWYQIREVLDRKPSAVLEVGIGNGLVANYLRAQGVAVITLDIDPSLKPDVVGSITKIPLPDRSVDDVLAAEVIEHIPFDEVENALREMARVSRRWVIVTTPDSRRTLLSLDLKLPFIPALRIFIKVPSLRRHVFNGQHYWEMGKRGHAYGKVADAVHRAGLAVERHYVPMDCPTKHVFILRKPA
mgnify:CR=1 FL=1